VVVWVRYQGQRQSTREAGYKPPVALSQPGRSAAGDKINFPIRSRYECRQPDHLEQAVGPPGIKGHLWVLFSCETAVPISRRPG
jgi:hypothetical protein